jgi:hypothetical protein
VQNIFTPKPQNPKIFQSEYFNDKWLQSMAV